MTDAPQFFTAYLILFHAPAVKEKVNTKLAFLCKNTQFYRLKRSKPAFICLNLRQNSTTD
ncbi:hypothetical protein C7N43_29955 [Sphingobacteriales bacterium UPWRP_1]|nr:hypothetical protein C7N43_29955 [Sphingobacteriales bacterium UPWRP_1]